MMQRIPSGTILIWMQFLSKETLSTRTLFFGLEQAMLNLRASPPKMWWGLVFFPFFSPLPSFFSFFSPPSPLIFIMKMQIFKTFITKDHWILWANQNINIINTINIVFWNMQLWNPVIIDWSFLSITTVCRVLTPNFTNRDDFDYICFF